jgi:hypothetical protein
MGRRRKRWGRGEKVEKEGTLVKTEIN